MLRAWGITTEGTPVLVGVAPAESECHDAWADFLNDLTGRGLVPPLLVVSDGAPGLIGATEVVLANSLRQRCLIHRARNALAKVPKGCPARAEGRVLEDLRRHRRPAGQEAVDAARARIAAFERRYGTTYPAAVKCLTTDVGQPDRRAKLATVRPTIEVVRSGPRSGHLRWGRSWS